MEKKDCRASGEINIHDPRGYAYFPENVRRDLGIEGKGKIPFFKDANCVLLVRIGATRREVLKGIDILKADLKLRWKEDQGNRSHDKAGEGK